MTCKACGFSHSALVRCEVAGRLRESSGGPSRVNPAVNVATGAANTVANRRELSAGAVRANKWREKNPEEYRARQRELMRKRREAARAGFSAEVGHEG